MGYDWTTFTKRIPVNTTVDRIYHAFSTRDGIESWFLRSAMYKKPDGHPVAGDEEIHENYSYSWMWHGYPDEVNENGTILKANGKDMIEFTFNNNGANDMRVAVTVEEEAGEHIVSLRQYNIPTDEQGMHQFHLGCTEGWTFYLANLKSVLEGGLDLRNKNMTIQKVVSS